MYLARNFKRNNCSVNFVGDSVLYTVAAGTYSSNASQLTANALALADLNANGQNYANQHGYCNPTIYAQLVLENQSGDYADVVVYFYSDAQGTTPLSVSNLTVYLEEELYNDLHSTSSYNNYSFTCNGYSTTLMSSAALLEYVNEGGFYSNLYHFYTLLGNGYGVIY